MGFVDNRCTVAQWFLISLRNLFRHDVLLRQRMDGKQNTNYDYGAVKLNGSPGNTVGWYGYRTTNSSSPVGLSSSVTGYPCDKVFGTMWSDTKPIRSAETYKLTYTTDTYGCQSGSPVYRNYSDTGQTAIAIHTNGDHHITWEQGWRTMYSTIFNIGQINKYSKLAIFMSILFYADAVHRRILLRKKRLFLSLFMWRMPRGFPSKRFKWRLSKRRPQTRAEYRDRRDTR